MKKHIALGLLMTAATTTSIIAGPFDQISRKASAEFYAYAQELRQGSPTTFFSGAASIKFDNATGGGFGFGYNLNDHFNVNFDFAASGAGLTATAFGTSAHGDATIVSADLNLDYNILKTRLTPVLTAGIGGIRSTVTGGGSSADEKDFTYGVGGGLRWDISDHWFTKAIYRATWTNFENSDRATMFHSFQIAVGYRF